MLYADALMNLSPWNHWNADGTPRSLTGEILERQGKTAEARRARAELEAAWKNADLTLTESRF